MKLFNKIIAALAIALPVGILAGCQSDVMKEITDVSLSRCLQPQKLNAKVSAALGNTVTFSWDVTKDAEKFNFAIYKDKEMTDVEFSGELAPEEIPYTIKLDPDMTYYFKVQAVAPQAGRQDSKWAVYDKAIKTFAVKDPLYPKVAERLSNAITISWSKDIPDYKEVTHVEFAPMGSDDSKSVELSAEQIEAASVTVTGLAASTEYVISVYYASASRGSVEVWTMPDLTGTVEVSTEAALEQGIKDGANIFLKMEGSPYVIASGVHPGVITSKGCKIFGEVAADGTRPVIVGCISIESDFSGSLHFEGVDFNGNNGACGHSIFLKEGGTGSLVPVDNIVYKNCAIHGYSKGLIYEWNQTFKISGEYTYDSCEIYAINEDGSGGGDVVDFRGKSEVGTLNIVNNTIYNGMRTFIRIDAGTWGAINVNGNTMRNLCVSDNSNNAGIIAINKDNGTTVGEFNFKKNLLLDMPEKATLGSGNAKYFSAGDLSIAFADNYYYGINAETFWTANFAATGTELSADPCYNSKGGYFNINADSEISGKQVGASKWWISYVEEPEDLTLGLIEDAHTWDLGNAKYFSGTVKKNMVRDLLYVAGSEMCPIDFVDGVAVFNTATVTNKKNVPVDGYFAFQVDRPGSVVVNPINVEGCETSHVIVAMIPADGGDFIVKGGASANGDPQKIVLADITDNTIVYVYVSGSIGIDGLAWSNDVSAVNRALPAPAPAVKPNSVTAGEEKALTVSWAPVDNAVSYSVVFGGKTYAVEDADESGNYSYEIAGSVVKMLDAGSYEVSVFSNPGAKDIYNVSSEAGKAAFAVLPAGGTGGDDEFIVSSVDELLDAISAGKDAITLKYSDDVYELGAIALTAPLHLKGQVNGDNMTKITVSATLSGNIGGSVILSNLDIVGDGTSVIIDDKNDAPVADTVAIFDSHIKGTKALYDNSGKAASDVQYVIFRGNIIEDCSAGADFIDMRAGAHHNFIFAGNTIANSCRTFVRTDAGHEMNYATIRNNTFYKVATNSTSKDNNGILHIRSAAGQGLLDYKVQNNLFYSILIDETPGHANGFPKLKSSGGLVPNTITNNYYFNCEDREEKADYSFWKFITKEEGIAGHGAILPADPCKDAENGDFTLTNGVAMNANVGDPRWNPARGDRPASEITVNNLDELLTAISAGKTVITLADGEYDFNAAETADIAGGKLTISNSLTLTGTKAAVVKGGFQFGNGVDEFIAKGISFNGDKNVDNAFYVMDGTKMSKFALIDIDVTAYKNRLVYQDKESSAVASVVISKTTVTGVEGADFTSGDFIDFRKGALTALKVTNSTFANGIRTFIRMDAAVVCNSVLVENNTFYNVGYAVSKDNNGIMHVRSTTATDAKQVTVRNNIFAGMKANTEKLDGEADNVKGAGFPHLVSKTSSAIFMPNFAHNYFFDLNTAEPYSFWQYSPEETAKAKGGVILPDDPFKDAANGDFTLVSALAASERVGDQRWNPNAGRYDGVSFEVATVEEMTTAIEAGKTDLLLTGDKYEIGDLAVAGILTINGKTNCGKKPEVIGTFTLSGVDATFTLNNLLLNGNSEKSDMIVIAAGAKIDNLTLRNCDVTAYKNRLISGPNDATTGAVLVQGCIVTGVDGANFTGGDFIDFRKGSVSSVKAVNNTFANAIRTFVRIDAGVVCGAVLVENNTFYNFCTAVSKDNNGIMHVRSTSATSNPRQIVCRKNIFACAQPDEAALADAADNVKGAGFPKLVSKASEAIAHPTCSQNLFFDLKFEGNYNFWNTVSAENAAAAGTVLEETPFSADPATGKFTVKNEYKGYGDRRW